MDIFLKILFNIYHYSVLILGHIGLVLILILIFNVIYKRIMMRRSSKLYVNAIKNSNFLEKTFEKMTPEEKENYKKSNGKLDVSEATVTRTIELTKELMAKYDIPAENVIRHYDVTHKQCPKPFVKSKSRWI